MTAAVNRVVLTPDECPGVPAPMLRLLNGFMAQVADALAGGLTVPNLSAFTVTVRADAGTLPVRFKNKLRSGSPAGVLVLSAIDLTAQGQPPASLGSPGWSGSGDQLVIHTFTGAEAGHSYSVTLLVLGQ